ncbi:adenylate/guanylate cyclase domain-containing protein [Thermodesulfobacteriota bacterium]
MGDENLITSKEIINKTGISRATLNNYIKMGILPKPIVKSPGPEQKGVKHIGYFPLSVLDSILKVKLLKQQGNSMEDIAQLFLESVPVEEKDEVHEIATQVQDRRQQDESIYTQTKRRVSDNEFQVTITDINSPAYLVNHNFEIEWINKPAEDYIFNRNIKEIVDINSRNVFRLLLNEELRNGVRNCKEAVLLHLTILQNRISANSLNTIYQGVTDNEVAYISELYEQRSVAAKENIYNIPVSLVKSDGSRSSFWVHSMVFREGTFFVYVPADNVNSALMDMLSQRGKVINELLRNKMPSLVSLGVLIADLQNSTKISAELLPAQYFELINELWQSVGPTFEKYNGIYGKHAGDGMLYYFIDKPENNYLMNAVNCAIEIREVMKELSSKWRLRKGWDNELFLNTGINEGQEFFGTIKSANNIEFTALGDTINIAGRLSDFARNGEIWTTKNLISRISQEERNIIRFGVHHENQTGKIFIRNSFSRISDIMKEDNPHFSHLSAIAGLPITEIKEKVDQSSGIKGFVSN